MSSLYENLFVGETQLKVLWAKNQLQEGPRAKQATIKPEMPSKTEQVKRDGESQ